MVRQVEFAIAYSGATTDFMVEKTPLVNVNITEEPLAIKLPDGSILWSTHTRNLDIS